MTSQNLATKSLNPYLKYWIKQEQARRRLLDFVTYTMPVYKVNWHHSLLCDYLDKFISGEIKRLMVFMPPQHGKSQLVSRHLPAYLLGKNPESHIIGVSYSSDLSASFNRAIQRIMDLSEYGEIFPETRLPSKGAKGNFLRNVDLIEVIDHSGSYKSVGIGGAITGNPADIAIIDDVVKDTAEAKSPTIQQRNWEWYNDVLLTRLHNDSRLLLTMTRWDENDLPGRILKTEANKNWDILLLPALKEDNLNPEDPRKIGEALWEEMHSKEKILSVRNQSKRTFLALYQQKPKQIAGGGEYFYNFKFSKHVNSVPFLKELPIHLSFDFNSKPYMTLVLMQIVRKDKGYECRIFRELCFKHPKNSTESLCKQFLEDYRYLRPDIFYYGDAQGERRIEGKGDERRFDDVRKFLNPLIHSHSKRTKNYNVSNVKRKEFMNRLLTGFDDNGLIIDEGCNETILDFENILEDKDGGKWKKKVGDPDNPQIQYEERGHTSDCIEYMMSYIYETEMLKPKH